MLAKLARYLRAAGLDATTAEGAGGAGRVHAARAAGRLLVTRSPRLVREHGEAGLLLLRSDPPREQLHEVLEHLGAGAVTAPFTRCLDCNALLEPWPEGVPLPAEVPEGTRRRHRRFERCPACGRVLWRGTHVARTARHLGLPDLSEAPPSGGSD
jgi:uncharacterized protein with PIN domain